MSEHDLTAASDSSTALPTPTGFPTLWTFSPGRCRLLERRVRPAIFVRIWLTSVTDMLIAILNCCTKEELEEEEETPMAITPEDEEEETGENFGARIRSKLTEAEEGSTERRSVIKNKILAVGRMSRVFALLRFVFAPLVPTYLTCQRRVRASI